MAGKCVRASVSKLIPDLGTPNPKKVVIENGIENNGGEREAPNVPKGLDEGKEGN